MREQPFFSLICRGSASAVRWNFVLEKYNTYCYILEARVSRIPWKGPAREGGLSMNGQDLREARRKRGWTQVETAEKLGVTQAYLSMLERGRRPLPYDLARLAVETLHAPPTALPLREQAFVAPAQSDKLSLQLAALGYPGFAHLRAKAQRNP